LVNYSVNTMGGTTSVASLDTGTISTMTNTSTLTVSSPNTGDNISIGTMNGTVDATHLVNYSVNTMGGTTSVGSLDTATIGTMTNTSTLTVSSPNTGDSISIGSMAGTVQAQHLTNLTITDLSGALTGTQLPNQANNLDIEGMKVTTLSGTVAADDIHVLKDSTGKVVRTNTIGTLSGQLTISGTNTGDSIS